MSRCAALSLLAGAVFLQSSGARAESGSALIEAQRQAIAAIVRPKKCLPAADPDEIVVCAERPERYRIEPSPPAPGTKEALSVSQERRRLLDYDSGGIGSCSTVGPGGVSGCLKRKIENSRN